MSEVDLLPAAVSAGTVVYPPGGTLGPRRQRDVQLVIVHEGAATIWVDGEGGRAVAAGRVALLLPGHRERFAFHPEQPTRHSWVQAHVPTLAPSLHRRFARLAPTLPLSGALDNLAREAIATAGSPLPTAPVLLRSLAAAALWRYAGEAEASPPEVPRPVDVARRFLHANLGDSTLTLAGLAAAAHVTPAHLIRVFRAETGLTPGAYLWHRRTTLGIELLTNTGLPIATIAERCGFKTVHHFSRRVKLATRTSPAALRRERWGPNAG
jgi:AraC-like DNA-binding protein